MTQNKDIDLMMMERVLDLASKGGHLVDPNPLVGCVIAQGKKVIANSYHAKFGEAHAERRAIMSASPHELLNATLYVNLEPCCHHGKTPPCTDLIIESGIKRVVIAMLDPNPLVNGKGVEALEAAGVQVDIGILEKEAKLLNYPFIIRQTQSRSYLMWKFAMTLDGHIAAHEPTARPAQRQILSSNKLQDMIHTWRGEYDAILIGGNTVKTDNPRLTNRLSSKNNRNPIRIIITKNPDFILTSKLMEDLSHAPLWIATLDSIDQQLKQKLKAKGIRLFLYQSDTIPLKELLEDLYKNNINNILMEGGSKLGTEFLAADLVDEFRIFIATKILGGIPRVPVVDNMNRVFMDEAISLYHPTVEMIDNTIYLRCFTRRF